MSQLKSKKPKVTAMYRKSSVFISVLNAATGYALVSTDPTLRQMFKVDITDLSEIRIEQPS